MLDFTTRGNWVTSVRDLFILFLTTAWKSQLSHYKMLKKNKHLEQCLACSEEVSYIQYLFYKLKKFTFILTLGHVKMAASEMPC